MLKSGLKLGCAVAGLLAGAMPVAAYAQSTPDSAPAPSAEPDDIPSEEEIVVKGELRGAVPGEIKPELTLNPADIRAYGVSSVSELIEALAPQTRSGRGRGGDGPVILLNGRRISNFSELRDLPPEAIERTEILPEEAALKYGYRADQRVVNIVLRPRFRAITAELTGGGPTAGGNSTVRAEAGIVRINRNGRINVNVQYDGTSRLTESERDISSTVTPALFDFQGNVTAPNGGEIDPALSAIAGSTVTIAGVPASASGGAPSLASFNAARNTTDLTPYRTLVSPSDRLAINAVISRNLSPKVSASFNARLEATNRESWLGLGGLSMILPDGNPFSPFTRDVTVSRYLPGSAPLSRTTQGRTAHAGFSVNGDVKTWRWSVTGNYDRVTSSSVTDTGFDASAIDARLAANDPAINPFGTLPLGLVNIRPADLAKSTSSVASVDALINGPVAKVPAGDIRTSLRITGRTTDFESSSLRSGTLRSSDVARDIGSAQLNLDLPLTSRRRAVLDALGDISINGNIEVEQLSDFGTLITTGYGVVWSPIAKLRLIGSVTDEEGAPSAQQLGDPRIDTPNVRVFDYVRGESVDITSITGGNPGLTSDSRNVFKIGGNFTPFEKLQFNISADFVRSTTRNQITAFPAATAEIEAAFPGRFTRDSTGRLVSIDTRAVNFARAEREELRWGFNLSLPLGSSVEKAMQEARAKREAERAEAIRNGTPLPEGPRREGGQPGGPGGDGPRRFGPGGPGGPGGGRGFGGFGGPGSLAGRIQFSLYHTIRFKDEIVIRDGLPVLDLLDGSATGNRGGNSRHEVEAQAGYSKDGYGLRLIGNWKSGTSVASGALGSGERLDFSSLGTLNLRAFVDMGQRLKLVREHRWLRGVRLTLSMDNIFDARQRVTDSSGIVPPNYQPDLLDPTGRTIRFSIRKLFF
jgi:hypothetical protein